MGTWGPGPFENDPAMDWALEAGRSRDPDLPGRLLRRVAEASWIIAMDGAKAVAAAETIAASRRRAAERLPDEIHRWLKAANPRAEDATAELALRVLARVQGEDSELRALWEEVDDSRWRGALDDLRQRLRKPTGPVIAPLQARRQDPGPPGIGDVIQLLTSTGQAAYVQFVGRAERPGHDLIRIMPGYSGLPLDDAGLSALNSGDTAFFSQGSFALLMGLTGSQARGNYPVPAPSTGPQPLKSGRTSAPKPGGGPVSYAAHRFTAEEFAREHPEIDQTMLTEADAVPSPGTLLRMIEREWRPWMADDDAVFLAEDPGPAPAVPQRPAPYPATAQPGRFLLDRNAAPREPPSHPRLRRRWPRGRGPC